MQYASEELIHEHEGILLGLEILEAMSAGLLGGKFISRDDLVRIVEFLKMFADKCHHGKEEGLLFPEREKYGIPNERGPIGQMLLEHKEGRKYIAGMTQSLENNTIDTKSFCKNADSYINLLRMHINKENTVLFPFGDKVIPITVQERLLAAFTEYEETVMGEGTHDGLHKLLESFSAKYLVR
jgi:hemerythrin-like domain-containing protein